MSRRVLVIEAGGWGGICHYTFCFCGAIAKRGATVRLLSGKPYELTDYDHAFEIAKTFDTNDPYGRKARAVLRGIKDFAPDVVHVQSTFSARRDWALYTWIQLIGNPLVFTAHNIVPHDAAERSAPGMLLSYDLIYATVGWIIVHGEGPRQDLLRDFRPDPRKISVIPHGDYGLFASEQSSAEAKSRIGIDPTKRVVLSFGAIREYKGIPELIEAFARCAGDFPDAILAIVGKPIGVDVEEYFARIRQLGLSDRVYLKPEYVEVRAMHDYLAAADIMAFPYRNIAQSGVLQLAYAAAKPVLVTAVGAFPETVVHGENGLVVPSSDPDALAAGLRSLLAMEDDVLLAMGERSAQLAASRHSWDEVAAKTFEVYDRMRA